MEYKTILLEKKERIGVITLNRPEVSNAFADESWGELAAALADCTADDGVGCILFTGAGKNFCAGGDIKKFRAMLDAGQTLDAEALMEGARAMAALRRCPKPTVAMVNGAASGAGASLAFACDFRVVTPRSRFAMAFIRMGLSTDSGGLYFLQKLAGTARATELLLTGQPVSGEEAHRIGLASQLAEDEALEREAFALAGRLAASPLAAIARQKTLINETFYSDLDAYLAREAALMAECFGTEDFREAVAAFLEKRTPVFAGK